MILPVFFWDSGPDAMPGANGQASMIATNCDRLEIYVGALHAATGLPDVARFGHLAYPPVFINLTINPIFVDLMAGRTGLPELRIDGYVRGRHVASARMSADTSNDRLVLTADDASIVADGSDATRVTFRALDAYGNQRSYVNGGVGPGTDRARLAHRRQSVRLRRVRRRGRRVHPLGARPDRAGDADRSARQSRQGRGGGTGHPARPRPPVPVTAT